MDRLTGASRAPFHRLHRVPPGRGPVDGRLVCRRSRARALAGAGQSCLPAAGRYRLRRRAFARLGPLGDTGIRRRRAAGNDLGWGPGARGRGPGKRRCLRPRFSPFLTEPPAEESVEAAPDTVAEAPAPDDPRPGPAPEEAPAPKASEAAHWLLSLFTPGAADAVDWGRGNYTVLARGGRVESPAGSGELKKQTADGRRRIGAGGRFRIRAGRRPMWRPTASPIRCSAPDSRCPSRCRRWD